MSNSYISIFVKNMQLHVRIGLLDHEKLAPQRLNVSIELFAAPDYLQSDEIIDYSILYTHLEAWEHRPHTELLETLLQELIELAFSFPTVITAEIYIEKPDIFEKTQQAGISAKVTRADYLNLIKK